MHPLLAGVVLGALVCSGCAGPQFSVAGGHAWSDPWPRYRTEPYAWRTPPGYGWSAFGRPALVCDRFGRCWRGKPFDYRLARGHYERHDRRPPGWAEKLPEGARTHKRFLRPRGEVVCDRVTRICYQAGKIDTSDTERMFGARAGERAERVRDRYESARVFLPARGVACDRERRLCVEGGDPDRKLTRRYFGRQAARDIERERARDDGRPSGKRGRRDKR
jgi:hypothetical protein